VSGLRQQLKDAISTAIAGTPIHASDYTQEADAALSAFRQWLEENGLVCVPREATDKMIFAAEDVLALGRRSGATISQALVSPAAGIWEAMIAAAPDPLGDGP
jgi:hypothetical protein